MTYAGPESTSTKGGAAMTYNMPLFENEENERLKERLRELESLLRQAEEALTFEWGGEPYNSRPLIDRIRKALEPPR